MSLFDLLLAAGALWRVSSLLIREAGPAKIFQRLRERAGILHTDDGDPMAWPDSYLGGLLGCVYCLSLTLAVPWGLWWILDPGSARWAAVIPALGAGALVFEAVIYGTR